MSKCRTAHTLCMSSRRSIIKALPGIVRMNPSKFRSPTLLCIGMLSLSLLAPSHLHVFSWAEGKLVRLNGYLHAQVSPDLPSVDLDQDGQPEQAFLQKDRLEIRSHGKVVWSSPTDWHITQARITDLNHDHLPEVTLLVWREFRPWPIDAYLPHPGRIQDFHDQHNRSCHLILIGWHRGAYYELWAGSALADPILDFAAADLDQDGWQELATLETQYDAFTPVANAIAIWEWNGFGFSLRSREPQGRFYSITAIETRGGQELLLVQGTPRR
jgi:hypothetical protein